MLNRVVVVFQLEYIFWKIRRRTKPSSALFCLQVLTAMSFDLSLHFYIFVSEDILLLWYSKDLLSTNGLRTEQIRILIAQRRSAPLCVVFS